MITILHPGNFRIRIQFISFIKLLKLYTLQLKRKYNSIYAALYKNVNNEKSDLKVNTPSANLVVNNNKSNSIDKSKLKFTKLSKIKKHKKLEDIITIDLTDDNEKKVVKKIIWLEQAKCNYDLQAKEKKETAEMELKREIEEIGTSQKIPQHPEDISRRSADEEYCSKLVPMSTSSASSSSIDLIKTDSQKTQELFDDVERQIEKMHSDSNSSVDPTLQRIDCTPTRKDNDELESQSRTATANSTELSSNTTAVTATPVELTKDERFSNLLCDENMPSDDNLLGRSEDASKKETLATKAVGSCSVIRRSSVSVDNEATVNDDIEPKKISNVNSILKKTDNLYEPKVQQEFKADNLLSKFESHNHVNDDKLVNIKNDAVNKYRVEDEASTQTGQNYAFVNSIKQYQAENSSQISAATTTTPNGYHYTQEPEIDGLTLLASVSAQHQVSADEKKTELKVKQYSSLKDSKPEKYSDKESIINQLSGNNPESDDNYDKIDLQDEDSSTKLIPVSEWWHQMLDVTIRKKLDSNGDANAILNGETVTLLQKSPNSNLYIINKAELGMNEDTNRQSTEDIKNYPHGMLMKQEHDEIRGYRLIKQEPGLTDVQVGPLIHDDSNPKTQECEVHNSGYIVASTYNSQPVGYYIYQQMPSHTEWPAYPGSNCPGLMQVPYYIPSTHATQSVQTNAAVQEQRSFSNSEEMLADAPANESLCGRDEDKKDGGKELIQHQIYRERAIIKQLKQSDRKLPPKKRFLSQLPEDFDSCVTESTIENYYPGTLMMSMTDVHSSTNHPYELGAVVEVTSGIVERVAKKGRKGKKANNQNVPNSFPRKNIGKRCNKADSSGPSAPKKPRKSRATTGGVKQTTRISKRSTLVVNSVQTESDTEKNPSGKGKKKRSTR